MGRPILTTDSLGEGSMWKRARPDSSHLPRMLRAGKLIRELLPVAARREAVGRRAREAIHQTVHS
jgi:hypothetical protein